MEKEINIQGQKIIFTIIDKKLKNTLVCIHGLDANRFFIGDLNDHLHNFNIVAISYDKINKLEVKVVNQIMQEIFNKHLKHTKLFVLGHSLGGLFASEVSRSKKIKKVFLLNPIHPFLWETRAFDVIKKITKPNKSKIAESSINLLRKTLKWKKFRIQNFIDPEYPWFTMVEDLIKNASKIKKQLHQNYQSIANKTTFLVSEKDNIIFAEELLAYLRENNFYYYQINYKGHSPLSDAKGNLIAAYLIHIKSKKRWWFLKNIVQ